MKTIKRIFAVFLVVCLCFGLSACGEADGNSKKSKETSSGFSTKEELLDAYMTMCYVRVVSKKEFKRIFPEMAWEYALDGLTFDEAYEKYEQAMEANRKQLEERFGKDYRLTWKITSVEDKTEYREYTEEERQECLDLFGVEIEDHRIYYITYSFSSEDSKEYSRALTIRKIGSRWYFF